MDFVANFIRFPGVQNFENRLTGGTAYDL